MARWKCILRIRCTPDTGTYVYVGYGETQDEAYENAAYELGDYDPTSMEWVSKKKDPCGDFGYREEVEYHEEDPVPGPTTLVRLGTSSWALDGQGPVAGTYLLWYQDNPGDPYHKVMWPDDMGSEQMDARDMAGALNENGIPFLVVVGGDSRLLYRIGPATKSFITSEAGYFKWPDPNTPDMDAQRIVKVFRDSQGFIQVTVIGGDGKTCEISQIKKNRAVFSGWRCG